MSQHTDSSKNTKAWAVSQYTDTSKNTKDFGSFTTYTSKNTKATLKHYTLHSYVMTVSIFSPGTRLAQQHPPSRNGHKSSEDGTRLPIRRDTCTRGTLHVRQKPSLDSFKSNLKTLLFSKTVDLTCFLFLDAVFQISVCICIVCVPASTFCADSYFGIRSYPSCYRSST